MTLENYRRNENAGITGFLHPSCFPASGDCISHNTNVDPSTYRHYARLFHEQTIHGTNSKRTKEAIMMVLNDLGIGSFKGITSKRAKSPEDTRKILDNAKQGGWRVIAVVSEQHVVGLRANNEGWRMFSTWTPVSSRKTLTPENIFLYLHQPREKIHGKPAGNIYLLAPEKNDG